MSEADERGFGRAAQSEVYRAGLSGVHPKVPVDGGALERAAKKTLSPAAFAYLAGGAGAEATMAANRAAFDRWRVWPRVLRDVSKRDLSIDLLGRRRATPFVLSPIGVAEMAHPEADVAVGRAAATLGVPYVLSNQASRPMEEVAAQMRDASFWFQLYWSRSDELNASFVRRAEALGCEAIVVTLDTSLLGWRTRDLDVAYLPFTRGLGIAQYTSDPVFAELVRDRVAAGGEAGPRPRVTPTLLASALSIARSGSRTQLVDGGVADALRSPLPRAAVETFLDVFSDPSLTWDDLASLREWTSLPILLKGVVHPADAARALDSGIDGIVVSNHGGRQIDGAVATLDALPGVLERVGGRIPVLLDSGVRGGADAFKALALGATAVGIGRPYAYGLAVAGAEGVREVVRNHIAELDLTMALAGRTSIDAIGRDALTAAP
ncbi:lactate 2-monooxygenase [Agromyces sp. CF514]|uniref:alpha-hydroxy-acid oxidizing protein n=1 Tax=Agromyces sp. CF514 TaxID=1881031 RepID=UPI0008E8262D|nr:alpha-hydroxy-acid oxidizing protein [Agromyces sp. CF514]SFR68066.1 lactate 2-monooxygenase [Agromyces sp. CF514]